MFLIELIEEMLIVLMKIGEYFFGPENERDSVIHPIIVMEELNLLILFLHDFDEFLSGFSPLSAIMNVNFL